MTCREKWKDLCKTPHRETAEKGEKVLQVAVQYQTKCLMYFKNMASRHNLFTERPHTLSKMANSSIRRTGRGIVRAYVRAMR